MNEPGAGLTPKMSAIRDLLHHRCPRLDPPFPAFALFFSVSDGARRARTVHATGISLEAAWHEGLARLRDVIAEHDLRGRWIRVDFVEHVEATTWGALKKRLAVTKRNYFRYGLALDARLEHAFLEQELNANAMLYGGNRVEHAVLNERNFRLYARTRFTDAAPDFSDDRPVFVLSTRGVFCDEASRLHELGGVGLGAGRRMIDRLGEGDITALIRAGARYLASQVRSDGLFAYGWHPCFDRPIATYNTLRHASTTYAMIEAWEHMRDPALGAAIARALDRLTLSLIHETTLPDGRRAAFLVDIGDEIKLGGNATALLALVKQAEVTGDRKHLGLMERLALGIGFMQDAESGGFVHVLHHSSLAVKTRFRTIYYEGEAAFALMRLYALTKDPRWIEMVERAFARFIAEDYWKHHDHWLGYAVNELTRHRPEARYFRFAIRNVADHLGFVAARITTFPTLLELMMAARETLLRIAASPRFHGLLAEIDLACFESALEARAHHLLNGHFWPETAMFFRNPDRILGAFFIRHHAFRVRIDDVEHYLSGLVAYRRYLAAGRASIESACAIPPPPKRTARPAISPRVRSAVTQGG